MQPIVAVIAPGMMGSAVGARLVENGIEVRTSLAGRSEATWRAPRRPAWSARPTSRSPPPTSSCRSCRLAMRWVWRNGWRRRCAPRPKKPIYVDCNALDPATVLRIARVVQETGATFVDGGIIGGPPKAGYKGPKIYLSGEAAPRVAELTKYGLDMPIQPGPIGAASAMKMSYAGITKGFTALGAAMMLAATRAGTAETLKAELSASQPALFGWLTRQMPSMYSKAYRWVAEMEEIAQFVGEDPGGAQVL